MAGEAMDWDHFRTFEAVARHGSLTRAAEALEISQSTVSRHLAKLEADADAQLFSRDTPVQLTERGLALLEAVRPMVDAALAARAALEATPEIRGLVTLTTVGELVRWVLAGRLGSFYARYPHVRLRILANNRLDSLAAGEADLAVRLVRPRRGDLVARKLRTESYALFASHRLALGDEVPWLGLTGTLAAIAEQRYAERAFRSRPARLLVEDVESLALAVQAGLGVAVLPRALASWLDGLVEVRPEDVGARAPGPVPSRDLWLVVHRSKQRVPRVRAVLEWLEEAFRESALR
jgi:DNA-binding transcriptional LysR family regulator